MNITEKFLEGEKEAWFKEWFDTSFYHQLYAYRNEGEAAGFVDELMAELRGSYMLDLGCGAGRHAKQLAWHDMRLPFGAGRFHYVFSFFTSFGYFSSDLENNKVINNIILSIQSRCRS